jgi:hypothetical protein
MWGGLTDVFREIMNPYIRLTPTMAIREDESEEIKRSEKLSEVGQLKHMRLQVSSACSFRREHVVYRTGYLCEWWHEGERLNAIIDCLVSN